MRNAPARSMSSPAPTTAEGSGSSRPSTIRLASNYCRNPNVVRDQNIRKSTSKCPWCVLLDQNMIFGSRKTSSINAWLKAKVTWRAPSWKRLSLNEVSVDRADESVVADWLVVRSGVEISDDDIGGMSKNIIDVIDLDVSVGWNWKAVIGDHVVAEVDKSEPGVLYRGINIHSVN